jgi:F-type H+-transporting ATPase subunit epsilon
MSLHIIFLTPGKEIFDTFTAEIFLPTLDGEICIQPRHQQLVSVLSIGVLRFKQGSAWTVFLIKGGVVEIKSDRVEIFSASGEPVNLAALTNIQERLTEAEEELKNAESDQEKADAVQKLQIISALLKATSYVE